MELDSGKLRDAAVSRSTIPVMPTLARSPFPLAIITDFGYRDHYAGAIKGVIASIAPGAAVIDITHGIPAQSVVAGAIALRETWRYFPARTVFLAVVDPGVGTARAPIAIETRAGARFVGPDNGLLWLAANQAGIKRIVKLTSPRHRRTNVSATFHGRDVFAPAAAYLWRGASISALGPALRSIVQLDLPRPVDSARELRGEVIYVDGFGNLVSNIDRRTAEQFGARFRHKSLSVRIKRGAAMRLVDAYGDAPKGAPLAIFGSFGLLEVAVRDGNAAAHFAAGPGSSVSLVAAAGRA
ncbi:MAG: SAM-dependent chlorinase/fluorinase [Candidatus Binatus sp.]|uniref:SAM hydrolase/SAM-dependent halogenase family protein n=1 Tax=Candidatus Binatus sp. TaxID=2811406 RepID=UPI003C71F1F7